MCNLFGKMKCCWPPDHFAIWGVEQKTHRLTAKAANILEGVSLRFQIGLGLGDFCRLDTSWMNKDWYSTALGCSIVDDSLGSIGIPQRSSINWISYCTFPFVQFRLWFYKPNIVLEHLHWKGFSSICISDQMYLTQTQWSKSPAQPSIKHNSSQYIML